MTLIHRLIEAQPSLLRRLKYETGQRDGQAIRTRHQAKGIREVGRLERDQNRFYQQVGDVGGYNGTGGPRPNGDASGNQSTQASY